MSPTVRTREASKQACFLITDTATKEDFADLSRYQPIAKDNSVIAWVTRHTKPDKHHAIEWRIRALDLAETEDGRHHRNLWERLHTNLKRQERRQVRDQRVAEADRLKDEL